MTPLDEAVSELGLSTVTPRDFNDFVKQIAPELLNYFVRRVRPVDDAADCLAETLLVLWRRIDSLPSDPEYRRAWSFTIAHNVLRNNFRAKNRYYELAAKLRNEVAVAYSSMEYTDDVELKDAINQLRHSEQEVILLIAVDGFSATEVGLILGMKSDAVRTRYMRARRKLASILASSAG